jgi:hypothetical protein
MPRPNKASGKMQQDEATSAPNRPPAAINPCQRRTSVALFSWLIVMGSSLVQRRAKQVVLTIVARLAHRSLPDSESRRRRNHEPPKSGIPKRKKIAMHIGFLAKSITFLGQIMVSDQLLPNSSRATNSRLRLLAMPRDDRGHPEVC